jgi:hypothetical protein
MSQCIKTLVSGKNKGGRCSRKATIEYLCTQHYKPEKTGTQAVISSGILNIQLEDTKKYSEQTEQSLESQELGPMLSEFKMVCSEDKEQSLEWLEVGSIQKEDLTEYSEQVEEADIPSPDDSEFYSPSFSSNYCRRLSAELFIRKSIGESLALFTLEINNVFDEEYTPYFDEENRVDVSLIMNENGWV